jgi:hypothetical protein
MTIIDRDALHQIIDELPDDALTGLAWFIEFLQFKHWRDVQADVDVQAQYAQSIQSRQLREQLARDYDELADEVWLPLERDDSFSWLKHVPVELQTEFLMDLLLATRRSRQSHDWSEVIQIVERWKAVAKGRPPFEPVNFPEGILQGYDFSPEFIAEARKEMWAGFGKEPE